MLRGPKSNSCSARERCRIVAWPQRSSCNVWEPRRSVAWPQKNHLHRPGALKQQRPRALQERCVAPRSTSYSDQEPRSSSCGVQKRCKRQEPRRGRNNNDSCSD